MRYADTGTASPVRKRRRRVGLSRGSAERAGPSREVTGWSLGEEQYEVTGARGCRLWTRSNRARLLKSVCWVRLLHAALLCRSTLASSTLELRWPERMPRGKECSVK